MAKIAISIGERPSLRLFGQIAKRGDHRPREIEGAASLIEHDFDDIRIARRLKISDWGGERRDTGASIFVERARAECEEARRHQGLVALKVHDDLFVAEPKLIDDLGEAIAPRLMILARKGDLSAGFARD